MRTVGPANDSTSQNQQVVHTWCSNCSHPKQQCVASYQKLQATSSWLNCKTGCGMCQTQEPVALDLNSPGVRHMLLSACKLHRFSNRKACRLNVMLIAHKQIRVPTLFPSATLAVLNMQCAIDISGQLFHEKCIPCVWERWSTYLGSTEAGGRSKLSIKR